MTISCLGDKNYISFITLSFAIFFTVTPVIAQNLLRNGGFEKHIDWVEKRGNKLPPKSWYSSGGSKYRLGYCTFNSKLKDEFSYINYFGSQLPRHGSIMTIISPTGLAKQGQHWINKLEEKLQIGKSYYVEYSVSRADYSCYSSSNLDVFLGQEQMVRWRVHHFWNLQPYFKNPLGPIKDSVGWVTIRGKIIANGNEKYFVLGNFNDQESVNLEPCDWSDNRMAVEKKAARDYPDALYYLDDVLLKPIGWSHDFNMPPNDTWEEKKIMKYFKSEFVFPKGDSIFIAENFRYLESIADDVKRNEGSFVEFCSTSYTDEDVGLATQRCEYITSQLKLLGLSENEFSISSHCENNYKMNEFQYKGKPHIAGSIEVIYR